MATSVTSAGLKAGADKVILSARPYLEFLADFSINFKPLTAARYDSIAVEVLNASEEAFGPGAGYTHGTNTIKPAAVSLTEHRKSTWNIGDRDALENELAPCWSWFGPKAGLAVAARAVTFAMSKLTYSAAASQITQATYSALADFTTIMAKVVDLGIDPGICVLLLNPTSFAALLSVLPAYVKGDDGDALRYARIGEFLGFKSVRLAPHASKASAAAANNGFGFVVPEGALAVADRIVTPVREGGNLVEFGTFTDDVTGFAFGTRVVIDADQGTCSWTTEALYGVALAKQTLADSSSNNAPGFYQLITA